MNVVIRSKGEPTGEEGRRMLLEFEKQHYAKILAQGSLA